MKPLLKPLPLAALCLAVGLVAGSLLSNGANANTPEVTPAMAASKAQIEAVVKEYIAAHGDELLTSIERASMRAQMAEIAKVIDADTPRVGPDTAPVTVIEFSDYECPFCARVQDTVKTLRKAYGNDVRWVYKNLPLNFHTNARPAAYAALAAHKQGKFWPYHNALWANQASLNEATYERIAKELKLDMKRFNADRASAAIQAQVDKDLTHAEALGARGTPHFIINGEGMSGALPEAEFRKVIDAKLKAAK